MRLRIAPRVAFWAFAALTLLVSHDLVWLVQLGPGESLALALRGEQDPVRVPDGREHRLEAEPRPHQTDARDPPRPRLVVRGLGQDPVHLAGPPHEGRVGLGDRDLHGHAVSLRSGSDTAGRAAGRLTGEHSAACEPDHG